MYILTIRDLLRVGGRTETIWLLSKSTLDISPEYISWFSGDTVGYWIFFLFITANYLSLVTSVRLRVLRFYSVTRLQCYQ